MTILFEPDMTPNPGPEERPCSNPDEHDPHVWQRGVAVPAPGSQQVVMAPMFRCPGVPGQDQSQVDT
jgi:hypothetical protein